MAECDHAPFLQLSIPPAQNVLECEHPSNFTVKAVVTDAGTAYVQASHCKRLYVLQAIVVGPNACHYLYASIC